MAEPFSNYATASFGLLIILNIIVWIIFIRTLRLRYASQLGKAVELATKDLMQTNAQLSQSQKEFRGLVQSLGHSLANNLTIARHSVSKLESSMSLIHNPENNLNYWLKNLKIGIENQAEWLKTSSSFIDFVANKKALRLVPLNLDEMIALTEHLFEEKIKAKGLRLIKETHPTFSFLGDRDSFVNHVLGKILSNAIKFSYPDASIRIVAVHKENRLEISVIDNGQGISQEQLARIFIKEHHTAAPGTSGERGLGFSLPLVKTVVESFGGEISITSTPKTAESTDHGTHCKLSLVWSTGRGLLT